MIGRYENKVVWLVGAGTPIGQALVKAFYAEGAELILSGVKTPPDGVSARCFPDLPVNDELARAAVADCRKLDAVVVVQPDSPNATVETCEVEFWNEELLRGLACPFCVSRAAMRIIGPQKQGSFCYVSSIHDEKPTGGKLMYSVCAGGISMLMREAAQDYGRLGGNVRANMVEVGPMEGDEGRMDNPVSRIYHTLETRVPRGRPGNPEEVCGPVLFLCSDEASYVNGANLRVDGGFTGYYSDTDAEARWQNGYA